MVRSTPGTDTIEDDIRATRRSIDDKVERIQRRLSPGDMVDSVVDFARTNGGAIAGGIGRGVRENPVPVALIGAGVRTGSRQVRHQAAALGQKTRAQASRAGRSGGRFVKEHPVLVGVAGIALGAAVAASLPRSGREDRAFGERADQVKTAAKDAAVKEGRKVQEAAKAAVAKARETAERKAPTADDLKRDAEQSVKAASEPKRAPGATG